MLPIKDTIPSRNPPVITWILILANCLTFAVQLSLSPDELERLFYLFGIVPARYTHPTWAEWVGFPVDNYWPFLTTMFLHGGWLHLIGNMWTLWIFGDNVEDRMGPVRFLLFYLLCGVLAGLAHWLTNANSTVPAVGASGAIAGILGAYFLLFPASRVIVLVPIFFYPLFFELPAFFYLGIWFLMQFLSGAASMAGPNSAQGVAWWAHIGGFVAGMVAYGLFVRARPRPRPPDEDEYGIEGAWMR